MSLDSLLPPLTEESPKKDWDNAVRGRQSLARIIEEGYFFDKDTISFSRGTLTDTARRITALINHRVLSEYNIDPTSLAVRRELLPDFTRRQGAMYQVRFRRFC